MSSSVENRITYFIQKHKANNVIPAILSELKSSPKITTNLAKDIASTLNVSLSNVYQSIKLLSHGGFIESEETRQNNKYAIRYQINEDGNHLYRVMKEYNKNIFKNPNMKISKKWLDFGAKVEMEHTKNYLKALKIASDHLKESPNYYKDWKRKEQILFQEKVNPMAKKEKVTVKARNPISRAEEFFADLKNELISNDYPILDSLIKHRVPKMKEGFSKLEYWQINIQFPKDQGKWSNVPVGELAPSELDPEARETKFYANHVGPLLAKHKLFISSATNTSSRRRNENLGELEFEIQESPTVASNPIADRDVAACVQALLFLARFPDHTETIREDILDAIEEEGLWNYDDGVTGKGMKFLEAFEIGEEDGGLEGKWAKYNEEIIAQHLRKNPIKREKWVILDWAGNYAFDKMGYQGSGHLHGPSRTFDSFDDAEEFLTEKLGENYDTDRGEYEIIEIDETSWGKRKFKP